MKFALVCCTVLAVAYCDVAHLEISNLPAFAANIVDSETTPETVVDETTVLPAVPALLPAASSVSALRAAADEPTNEYLPPDNEYLPPKEAEEQYVPPQARNLIEEVEPVVEEVVAAVVEEETAAPIVELAAENTNSIQEEVLKPVFTKTIPGAFGKDEINIIHHPNVPERIEIVPSSGYFYPQPKVLFLLRK